MRYRDIQRGETYCGRLVTSIYPTGSDGAGPGSQQVSAADDIVAYQDFREAVRTRCTAREFAAWATQQERKSA